MIRPLQEEVRSHLRSGVAITNLTQCVEELVLNSLDAGASTVTVRIDITNFKIQVSDNGSGIAFEDLKRVGERYSSSKCHVLKDLDRLIFYGFRGEALASVRKICDILEIVTRHKSSYQTYCKLFRNSQVLELAESRFPRTSPGTTVTVHNLFANLPVRRKSIVETVDFERVRHRIASIALIHPKTAFLLINDSTGANCLQTHVCKSPLSTFSQLFGNNRSKGLQQVKFEYKNFKVSGFISTDTHHSKSLQFIFVNGRLLLKTNIHKLVNGILGKSELLRKLPVPEIHVDSTSSEGYQFKAGSPLNTKITDRHGVFVLNIECLVTEYDICLEPAKTLIEFKDWDSVLYCAQRCVEDFLIRLNLISCCEQSPNSTRYRVDDENEGLERSCYPSLDAFEYRREIETSNMRKSLHSSTVFRQKKAETGNGGCQNKPSCDEELSVECHSGEKLKDSVNNKDTVGDGALCHGIGSAVLGHQSFSNNNLKSMSMNESLQTVEKSASSPDMKNVESSPSSCFSGTASKPSERYCNNQINDWTTCCSTYTASSSTVAASNSVKASGECSFELDRTSEDLVLAPLKINHCILSNSKASSCQSRENADSSSVPRNLLTPKAFSNKNISNNYFPENRRLCDSAVSFDKEKDSQAKNLDNLQEKSGSNQQSSVMRPGSTGASSKKVGESRAKVMSTFTSPCPITLQGVYARKRPQISKETSTLCCEVAKKNRRLITLQGNCKGRARYSRNPSRQSCDIQDGKSCAHSVACGDQILQELVDNDCSSRSSTTSCSDVVTGPHVCNHPENSLDSTKGNRGINKSNSSLGVTVPHEDTCDLAASFASNQQESGDSINRVCLSSLNIKQNQPAKGNIASFAVLANSDDQERVMDNWLEKESVDVTKETFGVQSSQCVASPESKLEPSLVAGNNSDTHKRKCLLNNNWYCTFDAQLGKNLFINPRTGHSSFEPPSRLNVEGDDCSKVRGSEDDGGETDRPQHVPHPVASHLSFSCTPWLPREDRKQQTSVCDNENSALCSEGASQLAILYQEHQEIQETEEKLCKWADADKLKAYEQNLFDFAGKSVAEMLESWQNPVFTAPEKDILMANKPGGCVKSQISVHNVVHPYRFTRDMLAGMKVLRQLDDKFIVGVLSIGGNEDDLLVLVDQHAAHERVRLEHLQSELFEDTSPDGKPQIKSSSVSPPLQFALFAEEVRLLKTFQTEIERIGVRFVISESAQVSEETSVSVHGVPSVLVEREVSEVKRGRPSVAVSKVKGLIREHLEHVLTTHGVPAVIPKVISQVISSQACHGAVKFGEPLGVSECEELIKRLSKCQLPFQCAHGRPSVIPLADIRFLGKKMVSQELECKPRMNKLRSALIKEHQRTYENAQCTQERS